MSSPIPLDEDIDPATMYAPPWARERVAGAQPDAELPPPIQAGGRGRSLTKSRPQFSGDRAMLELQRQLALNPSLIPEPYADGRSSIGAILFRLCGVLGVATTVAWGIVTYSFPNEALVARDVVESVSAENFASLGPSDHVGLTGAAASQPADTQQSEPSASPSNPPGLTVVTVPSQTVASGAADSTAASDASTARSSAPQANDWPIVQDELEMLLKRGKEFLADGDLASARLLLRRAAEGGSAEAALVLGTTFDPLVIQRLGVLGAHPDIGEARHWYQRAAELGSNTASQRLARLTAAP
jgi:hypothetical protein